MDISAAGCRVAVVDFSSRYLLVKDGPGPWNVMGGQGGGPGEYERPGRVAVLPNGGVVMLDQARQRFVAFAHDGLPMSPPFPRTTLYPNPTGGQLVAIDDSTLADYRFAARIPWRPIPDSVVAVLSLVDRLDLAGQVHGGWGHPVPSNTDDPTDVWRVNAGAMAVSGGRLFRLVRANGVLEEYGVADGLLKRTDTLEALTTSPGHDGVAGAVAVLDGERIVVVLRGSNEAEAPFPPEQLLVLDRDRRVLSRYRLTTRLTKLTNAGGGYLFALGTADVGREDEDDAVIDLLLIPGSDSTEKCGWRGR